MSDIAIPREQSKTPPTPSLLFLKQIPVRTFTMVFALIGIWLVFNWMTDGSFLQPRNLSNLFRQMTVTGVTALGMLFIIVAGHIDLSIGSTACFVGIVMSMLMQKGWSASSAVAASAAVGLLIGALQGFLVSYQRIPAFIVTLGGMMAFRGISMGTTGGITIPLEDSWIKDYGSGYLAPSLSLLLGIGAVTFLWGLYLKRRRERLFKQRVVEPAGLFTVKMLSIAALIIGFVLCMNQYQGVPVPVLLLIFLTMLLHFVAKKTVFGRHIYAVGGSMEASHLSGVNVRTTCLWVFVLMGALVTVAGLTLVARVGSASPDAGQLLELDAVASSVLGGTSLMGGRGTVFGTILGALIMESLNNGMSMANLESFWQYIIKGLVLVLAVWLDVFSQKNARA